MIKIDFTPLEECFENIKQGKQVDASLKRMKFILDKSFKQEFDVTLCKNRSTEFFGMSVFPNPAVCDKLVNLILEEDNSNLFKTTWEKINNWSIEIDSMLFDTNLDVNPAECVAILLHEIGHVVYSHRIPSRLFRVMKYQFIKLSRVKQTIVKHDKFKVLLIPSILSACAYKKFRYLDPGMREEMEADDFVIEMGYSDHLNSFLDKLIKRQGNSMLTRTEKDADREVVVMTKWAIDNVEDLKYRKKQLRTSLTSEMLRTPSVYVKKMMGAIKEIFFGANDSESNDRLQAAMESTMLNRAWDNAYSRAEYEVVTEGFFDNKKRMPKIDQSDIDYITVRSEEMQNAEDKIYYLDLIYYQVERIDKALQLIEDGDGARVSNSKSELVNMRRQLDIIRTKILKSRIPEQKFGLFVKYPVGYEG